jgi:hypothetical protein
MLKLKVQFNNFVYEYGFPMTLGKGKSDNYFIMRDNITGGLSIINHNVNIVSEIEITKIKINESNSLEIVHTNNLISHCMDVDVNSFFCLIDNFISTICCLIDILCSSFSNRFCCIDSYCSNISNSSSSRSMVTNCIFYI